MKRFIVAVAVLGCFSLAQAQAKAEGGYIMKSLTGSYSTWSSEQALNTIASVYIERTADSASSKNFLLKYGSTYRCFRITNNSGTLQKVKVNFINDTNITCTYNIPAYSSTPKLPFIKGVISGAVLDSTLYGFQIN